MCGINGFNFIDKDLIHKMNETTKHRGPDDQGVMVGAGWSLGHNRLSIIDLSELGHQPMLSHDKRYSIVYNGEIYNFPEIKEELETKGYSFVSESDTEVIITAFEEWGKGCLTRFNGMFAFAILDQQTGDLFFARDHIGIKPFYYYHKNDKFIFSSEVKAVLQHSIDRTLNKEALNIYFRLLYVPAPLTIWEDVYKLEPGHYGTFSKGNLEIKQYWILGNKPIIKDKNFLKKEISYLLKDSIEKQLISDREVGVFLSGGIDSTIIAGVASKISKGIKTFSISFEKTPQSEKYNNDAEVARKTAKYFGTTHYEYKVSAEEVRENLENSIYHMDEPISNHIQAVNLLLAKKASEHVVVVLGGDGGDELFGGYERYYYNYLIDWFQKVPKTLRENFIMRALFRFVNKGNLYRKLNSPAGVSRYLDFVSQKENQVARFLKNEFNDPTTTIRWYQNLYFKKVDVHNFTRQFMRTDLLSWLPNESLVRSDKMSMASGVEQRVPFLDYRLVELADRIPNGYKIGSKGIDFLSSGKGYRGKEILKESLAEYLPDFVLSQPKWGWFSPAAKWIRLEMRDYFEKVLSPEYCRGTQEIFDFSEVRKILENHQSGEEYALNTLWSIFTFQVWYKQFME